MTHVPTTAERLPLKDKSLFREQCYVDGQWIGAADGGEISVNNPGDGSVLGTVPKLGATEIRNAITAAESAFASWRKKTAKERSTILRRWFDLCMHNLDDLATILTRGVAR